MRINGTATWKIFDLQRNTNVGNLAAQCEMLWGPLQITEKSKVVSDLSKKHNNSHQQTLMYLGHLKRIQIVHLNEKETTAGRVDQVGMKLLT